MMEKEKERPREGIYEPWQHQYNTERAGRRRRRRNATTTSVCVCVRARACVCVRTCVIVYVCVKEEVGGFGAPIKEV